jgi:hypothetical protein
MTEAAIRSLCGEQVAPLASTVTRLTELADLEGAMSIFTF